MLTYLSGLTCTWENAITKAGLQAWAAEFGVIVVCPDTSPRGEDVPDATDEYDFGKGAGFYVDATEQPWSRNYRMYSYVTDELPRALTAASCASPSACLGLLLLYYTRHHLPRPNLLLASAFRSQLNPQPLLQASQ